MKMREKPNLKTIEEIPLEELESQSLVEGELLMAVIFNAANYMHHIICSNMLHMICSISYAIFQMPFLKEFISFARRRTDYSRMVFQNDNCD